MFERGIKVVNDYITLTKAFSQLTSQDFTDIAEDVTNMLCDLFNMEVFDDLTIATTKGNRYFIGFDGEDWPRFAVGWKDAYTGTTTNCVYLVALLPNSTREVANNFWNGNNLTYADWTQVIFDYANVYTSGTKYVLTYVKDEYVTMVSNSNTTLTANYLMSWLITRTNRNRKVVLFGNTQNGATSFYTASNDYYLNLPTDIFSTALNRNLLGTLVPLEQDDYLLDLYVQPSNEKYLELKICTRYYPYGNIVRMNGSYYFILRNPASPAISYAVKVNYIP